MRFAFFSRTDTEVRMRILEGRRSRLQERLDRALRSRGPAGADRYVTELQRHSIESVERELRWLTDLITAERNAPGHPLGSAAATRATPARKPASKSTPGPKKKSTGHPA